MIQKKIAYASTTIRYLQLQIEIQHAVIESSKLECEHVLELKLQYPIPVDDGRSPSRWWLHFACGECTKAYSVNYAVPLCTDCGLPLELHEADDDMADAARHIALNADEHAKKVYVFRCIECDTFHGFPTRIDDPKKKPSPS